MIKIVFDLRNLKPLSSKNFGSNVAGLSNKSASLLISRSISFDFPVNL